MATLDVEAALVKLLRDSVAVGAVAADRIYAEVIPQGTAFPAVVYERATSDDAHHMGGRSGMNIDEFDFISYAESISQRRSLAKAITGALDGAVNGATVTIGSDSVVLSMCHLIDEYEDKIAIGDSSGRYLFANTQTYKVAHGD